MDADVVISGAGPTGLMLAGELRLAGVEVLVVEQLPEPTGQSRSLGINPRAVELWEQRGLLERFGEQRFVPKGHYGALPVSLDFAGLDTPFGALLTPQRRTEEFLAEWATDLGTKILRGHELVAVREDEHEVEVDVVTAQGGRRTLRARYLAGCDGAHSTVRRLSGIGFPGTESTVDAVMADVTGVDLRMQLFQRGPQGLWAVFPVDRGAFRVVVYDYGRPPLRNPRPPSFEDVCEVAHRVGGLDLSGGTPHWLSRHGNTTRLADRLRQGRVLLVGDAAHVAPPAGGLALTTGLGDAVNLGWKLAAEVHGWAPEQLLDSYHSERHAVGERVMAHTRVQNLMMSGGPSAEALRTVVTDLLGSAEANLGLSAEVAGTGFRYPVGGGEHALLGRRLPPCGLSTGQGATDTLKLLRPARGVLIDLVGEPALRSAAAGWADRVETVTAGYDTAQDGAGLSRISAVLVRPDGHVVWLLPEGGAEDIEGLDAALRTWFGAAGPGSDSPS
ncbi:FAD-dependent monooxygenase [Streptomyces boncukensis]|uniref:Monooxygenase n=1 Tax=Streptomyces boncukensis TaxID=2711219 RepID=A0A6G4WZ04_9ACTN|nr:FAD-dependent monooxygenase [Streptomyces boncukensis]NGO70348.1 monooxygenase [Streptomyces boncukensis]